MLREVYQELAAAGMAAPAQATDGVASLIGPPPTPTIQEAYRKIAEPGYAGYAQSEEPDPDSTVTPESTFDARKTATVLREVYTRLTQDVQLPDAVPLDQAERGDNSAPEGESVLDIERTVAALREVYTRLAQDVQISDIDTPDADETEHGYSPTVDGHYADAASTLEAIHEAPDAAFRYEALPAVTAAPTVNITINISGNATQETVQALQESTEELANRITARVMDAMEEKQRDAERRAFR